MAVRNSDRHAVRPSRRRRPWRQKYGLDLKPHCGMKTRPHYGPLIRGPLQNKDLGAQIEDRIAVPNQDRVFDGWGGAVATTLLRIPWPRGHQKAARSRPHGGLKSKPPFPFRWLERPRGQRLAVGSLPAAVQSWMALPAPRAPVAPAALPGFSAPASAAAAPLLATAPYFTRSVAAAMSASSSSGSASTSAPAAVAHLLITPRWTPRGRAL